MGLFITIEGIEGAGKSTLIELLKKKLGHLNFSEEETKNSQEIVTTREPGSTEIGRELRKLLLGSKIDPITEVLLFYADRAEHLKQIIRPALERSAIVICDRFIHSTLAYQGYGRGFCLEALNQLNSMVVGGCLPDLVLLLDIDPELGLSRAKDRALQELKMPRHSTDNESSWTKFEQEKLDFHKKIRSGFLELAKNEKNKIQILDATCKPEELAETAFKLITEATTEISKTKAKDIE
jgi:dTMP kinase